MTLFEVNRNNLKGIFSKHAQGPENRLPLPDLLNILKQLHLVPTIVGQGTVRSLVTKVLNVQSISRAQASYTQFEEILMSIAINGFEAVQSKTKRIQSFFSHIISPCKSVYQIQMSHSEKLKRQDSLSQNDSLELDMNIQEALKTLKITGDTPKRSQSGTPSRDPSVKLLRQRSPSTENIQVTKRSRKTNTDMSKRILSDHIELQEFLKMEQEAKTESKKVTVNLRRQELTRSSCTGLENLGAANSQVTAKRMKNSKLDTRDESAQPTKRVVNRKTFEISLFSNGKKNGLAKSYDRLELVSPDTIKLRASLDTALLNMQSTQMLKTPRRVKLEKGTIKLVAKSSKNPKGKALVRNTLPRIREATFAGQFVMKLLLYTWRSLCIKKTK